MNAIAAQYNLDLTGETGKEKFLELIEILAKEKQKKIVVLIDEYDKPIIDYMEDIPQAKQNRDILKSFYSVLKAQTHNIRFLFITGVSKFSRVSIFSDLNHLNDITLFPQYSRILGYTQDEIEYYFAYYITKWEDQTGQDRQVLFEKLKDFYNGYSWDGVHFVYNPFSILRELGTVRDFRTFWFLTELTENTGEMK